MFMATETTTMLSLSHAYRKSIKHFLSYSLSSYLCLLTPSLPSSCLASKSNMLLALPTYRNFSFTLAPLRAFVAEKEKALNVAMFNFSLLFFWWRQSKDRMRKRRSRRRRRTCKKRSEKQFHSSFVHSFTNRANHLRQDFETSFLFTYFTRRIK